MFRATVVRRFGLTAPQLQAQSKIIQQAMSVNNSATSTSSVTTKAATGGRVAMMPSTVGSSSKSQTASNTVATKSTNTINESSNFDDILTVGTVSAQGDGQKIFKTAHAVV